MQYLMSNKINLTCSHSRLKHSVETSYSMLM